MLNILAMVLLSMKPSNHSSDDKPRLRDF